VKTDTIYNVTIRPLAETVEAAYILSTRTGPSAGPHKNSYVGFGVTKNNPQNDSKTFTLFHPYSLFNFVLHVLR
jgi:hypothetical protein